MVHGVHCIRLQLCFSPADKQQRLQRKLEDARKRIKQNEKLKECETEIVK